MILPYKKNALLSLLAQFRAKLYEALSDPVPAPTFAGRVAYWDGQAIIDRNLTSIEKQIKKL